MRTVRVAEFNAPKKTSDIPTGRFYDEIVGGKKTP